MQNDLIKTLDRIATASSLSTQQNRTLKPLATASTLAAGPGFDTLFGGIAFIRGRPVVLGAISLDLFAVLLGGATALLPIYARDILLTGPLGLGLLHERPQVAAKLVPGKPNRIKIARFYNRAHALRVIRAAMRDYADTYSY